MPTFVTCQQRSQSARAQQILAGGPERAGLLLPATAPGIAGHPDGDLDPGLGDVDPGGAVGEQRLVFCFKHHRSYDERGYTVAAVRSSCGASGNLVRGLEAPGNSPEKQLPAVQTD